MDVPDLGAKVVLLLRYGPERRKSDLAKGLGVGVSTLNGWISGTPKSAADWVPDKRWPVFLNLFAAVLPARMSTDEVRSLVLGRPIELERAFLSATEVLIADLIEAEARADTARLHRCSAIGLVELDEQDDPALPSIKLNEPFMMEVQAQRSGYVLVLNNAGQSWGIVEFADKAIAPKLTAGSILVPGMKDFRFICMRERTTPGPHQLVLFVSPEPFPLTLTQMRRNRMTLDWPAMRELASFFSGLPRRLREIHLLRFNIT